ncbi:MAG: N-acetylmuramoyl-L-alanine amidase [Clostridiales bacterium]|nr:N-acetylmuramoyl-L-alanine amidase [Clostridiales bacterium]
MKIEDKLLTKGASHGRSGKAMVPKGILIHYVGNPGSSALGNRNYFENGSGGACVSAHYIIGLQGEILLCVPETECAAHAGKSFAPAYNEACKTNNSTLIGIECCHPGADGKFNEATTKSLVELVVDICKRRKLNPNTDVKRHYDVTGKSCPKYYVEHPAEWTALKAKIVASYNSSSSVATATPTPAPAANAAANANEPSDWAKDAWNWAKERSITDGTEPKSTVTREQTMVFLRRALIKAGITL